MTALLSTSRSPVVNDKSEVRRRPPGLAVVVALVAMAVPVAYTLYAHHVWEDYLITFRFSQNLAEGRGLTYNPSERVHGFTSPIGVLLPALFHAMTGKGDYHVALNCFRAVSAVAFGLAAALTFATVRRSTGLVAAALLAALLLAFEPKSVSYSANGQEQAFMLLCAAGGLWLSLDPPSRRWWQWALVFAGFQWTRPDGVMFCAALALANLLFPAEPRRRAFAGLFKGVCLGAAIYVPWFVFTWAYFGSPIPHTIVAKSGMVSLFGPRSFLDILLDIPARAAAAYRPVFYAHGDWLPYTVAAAYLIALFAMAYWLFPRGDRVGRVASFCVFLIAPYFAFLAVNFAWYYPPFALMGIVALAAGVPDLVRRYAPRTAAMVAVVLVLLVVERAMHSYEYARLMKVQQAVIETGNRTKIGLFLREHVKPGETVYLEPLGYIGFFSNAHMLDHPGLVSPQVSRLIRHEGATFQSIIPTLQPDWIVLRFAERLALGGQEFFMSRYEPVKWFDVLHDIWRHEGGRRVHGRPYVEFDSTYIVFRKKPEGSATTRPVSVAAATQPTTAAATRPSSRPGGEVVAPPRRDVPGRRFALPSGQLFVPDFFTAGDRTDLVVWSLGATWCVEQTFHDARRNAVLLTLDEKARAAGFADAAAFDAAVAAVLDRLRTEGVTDKPVGRLCLGSFSGGYTVTRQLLRFPDVAGRVTDVVLADSLYAGRKGNALDEDQMRPFLDFAGRAAKDPGRTFVFSQLYPPEEHHRTNTTTLAAFYLTDRLGVPRLPATERSSRGAGILYRAERNGLHVLGYSGMTNQDHADHLYGMAELLNLTGLRAAAAGGE